MVNVYVIYIYNIIFSTFIKYYAKYIYIYNIYIYTMQSISTIYILNKLYIIHNIYTYTIYSTSSTAQGGGGSFKNRKPIGELGCCESGMAERSH